MPGTAIAADCIVASMRRKHVRGAVRRARAARRRRRRSRGTGGDLDRAAGRAPSGRSAGRSTRSTARAASRARTTTCSRATSSTTRSRRRTAALEDDCVVLEDDGALREACKPFTREEMLQAARGFVLRPLARLAAARPLEVRVRDRVAVRIVRREAERAVDPRLELLRDHVLEPVGLVVDVVDARRRASRRGRARAAGGAGSPRARPARRRA